MFCAAIPATLALGAHANARQRRDSNLAEARGEEHPPPKVEPKTATGIAVAGLVVASVWYHTQFGS
jgi:hypothetical protein